jgi:hypothetical protein
MLKSCVLGVALLAALALQPAAAGPDSPAVVTILEGSAIVIRGSSKLAVAECARVQPDDLFESGKSTLVRLEFDDGTRLDLGPATQLQVNHPTEIGPDRPALYLLSGWIKLSFDDSKRPRAPAFATPVFDGTDLAGVVLAHIDARGILFVEQGRARIANRHGHAAPVPALKTNDFVSVGKDGKAVVDSRPSHEFVDQMPKAFRDSIPSRWARCREREVTPKALGDFTYSEVEPWINAEQSVRRQFVRTWRAKADDPAFRLELMAKLRLHPEWGSVLLMVGPPWPLPEPPAPHQ